MTAEWGGIPPAELGKRDHNPTPHLNRLCHEFVKAGKAAEVFEAFKEAGLNPRSTWCQPEAVAFLKRLGEDAVVEFLDSCIAEDPDSTIKSNPDVLSELLLPEYLHNDVNKKRGYVGGYVWMFSRHSLRHNRSKFLGKDPGEGKMREPDPEEVS